MRGIILLHLHCQCEVPATPPSPHPSILRLRRRTPLTFPTHRRQRMKKNLDTPSIVFTASFNVSKQTRSASSSIESNIDLAPRLRESLIGVNCPASSLQKRAKGRTHLDCYTSPPRILDSEVIIIIDNTVGIERLRLSHSFPSYSNCKVLHDYIYTKLATELQFIHDSCDHQT